MISIVLLIKIIVGICFFASWFFMFLNVRRTQRQLECLREYCDERLTAMAQIIAQAVEDDEPQNNDLAEARRRALEAERRFTEGITSILNFSSSSARDSSMGNAAAGDLTAGYSITGKKGE